MPIENLLLKAKQLAKEAVVDMDWLSKAKTAAVAAAPSNEGKKYDKLPSLKIKPFALKGSKEDPALMVVKAITDLHMSSKLIDDLKPELGCKQVFEGEIIMSSDTENAAPDKYNIWMDYSVLQQELEKYKKEQCNGNLAGATFVIAAYGKVKKQKDPRQSFYPFRVLPPP